MSDEVPTAEVNGSGRSRGRPQSRTQSLLCKTAEGLGTRLGRAHLPTSSPGPSACEAPDMTLVQAKLSRAVIGLIVLILSVLLIGFSHYSRELQLLGGYLQKKCLQKGLQSKLI